jgi:hypothetical protein
MGWEAHVTGDQLAQSYLDVCERGPIIAATMEEELEHPQEHMQEQIHEAAHHTQERWIFWVAMTAALLAAFAAIASSFSGHHEHEAMLNTVQASDKWNYYQAEGIKLSILEGRLEVADAVGGKTKAQSSKIKEYTDKRIKLEAEAKGLETEAGDHDAHHLIFSRSVTLFQVAIAISAISVLSRLKPFWFVSMGIGALGLVLFVYGFR